MQNDKNGNNMTGEVAPINSSYFTSEIIEWICSCPISDFIKSTLHCLGETKLINHILYVYLVDFFLDLCEWLYI